MKKYGSAYIRAQAHAFDIIYRDKNRVECFLFDFDGSKEIECNGNSFSCCCSCIFSNFLLLLFLFFLSSSNSPISCVSSDRVRLSVPVLLSQYVFKHLPRMKYLHTHRHSQFVYIPINTDSRPLIESKAIAQL